jgi:undecaprenyl-diphosphatase
MRAARHQWMVISLILLVGVAGQLAFVLVSDAVINTQPVLRVDQDVATVFYDARQPAMIDIFEVFTVLGSQVLYVLGFGLGAYFIWRRWWVYLFTWALAMGIGKLVNICLKDWFARPRPAFDGWIQPEAGFGYPSGHAMQAMLAYGMLAYFALDFVQDRRARAAIMLGAALLIGLISFSRLVLSVHFLSDVVGGLVAGLLWLLTAIAVFRAASKEDDL